MNKLIVDTMCKFSKDTKAKLYHISHNDLDGVSPLIISNHVFGDSHKVSTRFVSNGLVDSEISTTLSTISSGDLLLITDLSPSEEIAKELQYAYENGLSIIMLDHHKTALHLNEYDWAYIAVEVDGTKQSATNMYYDLLVASEIVEEDSFSPLSEYVAQVRLWDTWDWTRENIESPKFLNSYYYLVGYYEFSKTVLSILNRKLSFILPPDVVRLLAIEDSRIARYLKGKNNHTRLLEIDNELVAVTFADQYLSELGNFICEKQPEVQYVAMIDVSKGIVSLRSTEGGADVSVIASAHGGGGHHHAAGCPLNTELINLYVQPALLNFK